GQQYTDEWLDKFVKAQTAETAAAMREWESRYGRFNYALVTTRPEGTVGGFDQYFRKSPDWKVIKRTPTATFYERTTPSTPREGSEGMTPPPPEATASGGAAASAAVARCWYSAWSWPSN